METAEFVRTSIASRLVKRMNTTHTRRGISIFAGPPGIGKTTAINAFASERPGEVAVVKVNNQRAGDRIVMQHMVEAMRDLRKMAGTYVFHDSYQVRGQLAGELAAWADRDCAGMPRSPDTAPPLTFVFDEAQNLGRGAIEALRYWNDRDRCYGPFPIGLVFIGNAEFSLETGKNGASIISAAVEDRATYVQPFEYDDVSNADIALFVEAAGIADRSAIAAVVKHFSGPRTPRSFRQIKRIVADLLDEAAGEPVTIETARAVLCGVHDHGPCRIHSIAGADDIPFRAVPAKREFRCTRSSICRSGHLRDRRRNPRHQRDDRGRY